MKLITGCILSIVATYGMAADSGEMLYKKACKTCHAPLLSKAIKSPAAFNKEAWDKVFAVAKQQSKENPERYKTPMDYLLAQVRVGKGLMHQGGLCNETFDSKDKCSDENLISAINYMAGKK